ncbi:MAG: hypothetical protein JOZ48_18350 [Acidobacteriaceae bacterium]|nr:hypothetical protein [Acidobacteriaceae bacterium]
MIRHVKPAEEYSAPLDQAKKAKDNLWELAESGMFKDKADQFRQRLDILEARIAELKDKPSKPAETKWEPTNTTVREYWESLAPDDRWDYLRYMRVKAKVSRNTSESTQENEADECEGIKRLSAETAELCKTIPPITAEMLERSYEHRWQTVTRQYGEITLVIDLGDMAKLRELATKYPG